MGTGTSVAADARDGLTEGGFTRVVCGLDGRRMGFEAARQAARLTAPSGRLTMVAVAELFAALSGRWGAEPPRRPLAEPSGRSLQECMEEQRRRARRSLEWAERQIAPPEELTSHVVDGEVAAALLGAAAREEASLIAVGAHGGSRLPAALLAEASALVLHDAPMSVLVARPGFDPGRFPAHMVVGVDGSDGSQLALRAAAAIRARSGGTLTVVTAGRHQEQAVACLDGFDAPHDHVAVPDRPVEALVRAARTADLTIVGSRGLHGARALGSVSERVAFRALSSVLVVRPNASGEAS